MYSRCSPHTAVCGRTATANQRKNTAPCFYREWHCYCDYAFFTSRTNAAWQCPNTPRPGIPLLLRFTPLNPLHLSFETGRCKSRIIAPRSQRSFITLRDKHCVHCCLCRHGTRLTAAHVLLAGGARVYTRRCSPFAPYLLDRLQLSAINGPSDSD